jgi:hypothetical protein
MRGIFPCTVRRVPCTIPLVPCAVCRVPRALRRVPCTVLHFNFTFRVLALSPRRIPMVKESLSPNF